MTKWIILWFANSNRNLKEWFDFRVCIKIKKSRESAVVVYIHFNIWLQTDKKTIGLYLYKLLSYTVFGVTHSSITSPTLSHMHTYCSRVNWGSYTIATYWSHLENKVNKVCSLDFLLSKWRGWHSFINESRSRQCYFT